MPTALASGAAPRIGGSVGEITFNTQRQYYGYVKGRFTDISPDTGASFSTATATVRIVDPYGTVLGSASLSKTWGVLPEWKVIAYVAGSSAFPKAGRLRMGFTNFTGGPANLNYYGSWSFFDLALSWG